MKNAMKKLMAFALVAVMLVGVLPFAAFANETDSDENALTNGCHKTDATKCTNDFPNHAGECVCVCNGSATCYPGSVKGLKEYHQDGCQWLANKIAAEEEAARKEAEEAFKRDTNNCTMDDDCPVIVPYHKVGCVKVAEYDKPLDDGNKCTHDFNCKHTGNLHEAGCPMIPCTGDADCDHGGFNHKNGCPFVCNGKSNCPQAANQDARYHVADCASLNSNNNTGSGSNGSDSDTTDTGIAYIYVGSSDMPKTRIVLSSYKAIGRLVNDFDADDDKHYEFAYYTVNGSSKKYDDTDVVGPDDVAHIYVKVKESKANDSKVYLQIYMNNNFETPAKTLNVTTMATEDGLNLYGNVEDLILDYFTAKDSSGINMDGMYRRSGSWIFDFLEDAPKYKNVSSDDIIEYKEDKDFVVYNIMVTNAKLKSSGTADSTNPKTGDNIFVAVSVMTVAASALAVAFYLNKKRAV